MQQVYELAKKYGFLVVEVDSPSESYTKIVADLTAFERFIDRIISEVKKGNM